MHKTMMKIFFQTTADEATAVTNQQLPVIPYSHDPYEISTNHRFLQFKQFYNGI